MKVISSSSILIAVVSVMIMTMMTSSTFISAGEGGLTIRSYSTNDCTGSFKTTSYSPDECKPSSGTSAKYSCNSTKATLTTYRAASDCTGASSTNNYNIGQCYPTSASLSTMYMCGAGQVAATLVVIVAVIVSLMM